MVEWGVSSKCHSAQAPVSLARVTSYNCNCNCNYSYNYKLCKIHLYSAKVNKCKSLTMCTWSKGSNGPM